MNSAILDVDLMAFERGDTAATSGCGRWGAKKPGHWFRVYEIRSLQLLMDSAYGMLESFFSMDLATKRRFEVGGSSGQTGYTGVLRETAADSDWADWKEMLNWSVPPPLSHPLRRHFPTLYPEPVLPDALVPGLTRVLMQFHQALADLQRRFLRVVALAMGCAETFFEEMVRDAPTLTRAIHYPPMAEAPPGEHLWAAAHGDINLITALPRASGPGLQVLVDNHLGGCDPPRGSGDHQFRIDARTVIQRSDPLWTASGCQPRRILGWAPGGGAVLPRQALDRADTGGILLYAGPSPAFCGDHRRLGPGEHALRDQPAG